jgi:predicted ribonuclease toxin of YeeF-YezG toxin-antitoxin module
VLDRSRRISGALRLKSERRSKDNQRNAGKPDRRDTDDGGHYIAARFNGPRQRFNHFAQDRNFNRGAYRALEDQWAKALRQGKRVFVDIVPQYEGMSKRPKRLKITWRIDGQEFEKELANEPQSK